MLNTSFIVNLTGWLAGNTDEKKFAALINQLLPYFRISPACTGSKAENDAERRQLIAEFLCLYKQQHGKYILMGEFGNNHVVAHFLRRLNDFAMNCRSSYRQALIRRVNSVVRPAHGFKKKKGRIVGRIADIDNNVPTSFDENSLINLWKHIARPPVKAAATLPAIKDLIPVVSSMFSTARGWVFKNTFYLGFETILRLVEPSEHPAGGSETENGFFAAIEEMAAIPASFTSRVALALTIEKEAEKLMPEVDRFVNSLNPVWKLISRSMLIDRQTAAETAARAGISQQGCGRAAKTIIQRLRAELFNLDEYQQLAYIHTFVRKLYSTEHGEVHE